MKTSGLNIILIIFLGVIVTLHAQYSLAQTTINSQIAAACTTGGSVILPSTETITETINLVCPNGNKRVSLKGSPSTLTCMTSPCIVIGSADEYTLFRPGLTLQDVSLVGPDFPLEETGDEGILLLDSSDQAVLKNIRIDYFDTGIHFNAANTGLIFSAYVSDIVIGYGSDNSGASSSTVNTAVHLDGPVANIKFVNFELSAQKRLILSDGPGGSGAGASFTNGQFNTTTTRGIASILVDSSDGVPHELQLTGIEDWETACPFLEVGRAGRVNISQVSFNADVQNSGNYPGYRLLPDTISYLRITNSIVANCSGSKSVGISVESASAFVAISSSELYGNVEFLAPAQATFVGNRCNSGMGFTGGTTNLANVRASANIGPCTDR